LNRLW